jgi:hypothetical protein
MKYYTYAHHKLSDNSIFYIGKGTGKRAYEKFGRGTYWNRTQKKYGYAVEILSRWDTEEEAYNHEVMLIGDLKSKGFVLCNLTDGGGGPSGQIFTDEYRKKLSIASAGERNPMYGRRGLDSPLYGRKKPETSIKLRGEGNPMYGRRGIDSPIYGDANPSKREEVKRAISKANKGRIISPENIEKLRIRMTGRKASSETKERMSVSQKAIKKTPTELERMSQLGKSRLGYIATEETKEKIRIAATGRRHTDETKRLCSIASKKRIVTDETRRKIGLTHKGKVLPQEHIEMLRALNTGKKASEETKLKLRQQIVCPHCGKIGGQSIMKRWHFDNCKLKDVA